MSDLTIIRAAARRPPHESPHRHVRLTASRATLAKRRWRGTAEDGREFGFDLDAPLHHGDHFYIEGATHYVIEQASEEVLEIPVASIEGAARVAWSLGNLHFGVQVLPASVRVTPDSAILQMLEREHTGFQRVTCVFQPLSAGAHHHHAHDHGHHHHD